MKKSQLIEILANRLKLTKKTTKEIVDAFLEEITKALAQGERVKLSGFGVFWTRLFKPKQVLPIGQDKKKKISSRRMPRFTPGTALKKAVR
ncbi:HU family DNA-binding protein [bacterium]|nr:HU family DNA-binding protein [bacterium]